MPELVQYDTNGKPFAVSYQYLAPLLLAMIQNAHKKSEEQLALLMTLKEQNEVLRKKMASLSILISD